MSTLLNTAVSGASCATAGRMPGTSWGYQSRFMGLRPTPHVLVGIFIVNNNPKTMTLLFLQPKVCIGSISSGSKKPGAVVPAGRLAYFR